MRVGGTRGRTHLLDGGLGFLVHEEHFHDSTVALTKHILTARKLIRPQLFVKLVVMQQTGLHRIAKSAEEVVACVFGVGTAIEAVNCGAAPAHQLVNAQIIQVATCTGAGVFERDYEMMKTMIIPSDTYVVGEQRPVRTQR